MDDRVLAQEAAERLGRKGKFATWGWCELVTHPCASELRDQYVAATALGIAMRLGGEGRDAYESLRTLSQRLSLSRRVVYRSAWALEAGGWLDAVGNGPKGTIRWNATIPADVFEVLDDVHHGDGLPWVELLVDDKVTDAISAAFVPVAAYVAASKGNRPDAAPVDSTTGATERPVDSTAGDTGENGSVSDVTSPPVDSTAGDTPSEPPDPVASTVGDGVASTVGDGTSRDPTKGSYENGLEERTHENATCEAEGCPRPVAVKACAEDPDWRDLCVDHADEIRRWAAGRVTA